MNLKFGILAGLTLWISMAYGQEKPDQLLFSINSKPFYSEEFKRTYTKNLELVLDEETRDLSSYLDLYIDYKLKVEQAYALKLDREAAYIAELKEQREQLVKKFLTDEEITESLIEEAYQRSLFDVRASHILVSFAQDADTTKAYDKALRIRREILAGTDFAQAAKYYSEDPSAVENAGDLGYFTVFKMIYPFETAAYNTEVGEVSMPVRTDFGYHLIQVNDKRAHRGDIEVAHIVLLSEGADRQTAPQRIAELYQQLQNGADFGLLAAEHSQDPATRESAGKLPRFAGGALRLPEFEDVAFNLEKEGDYSEPVQTKMGWHLVRLIRKYPLPSLEESRAALQRKIKYDSRSRVLKAHLDQQIRAHCQLVDTKKGRSYASSLVDDKIYSNSWKTPEQVQHQVIAVIEPDHQIYVIDFLDYIQGNQQQYRNVKPLSKALEAAYSDFVDQELKQYYVDHLEEYQPDFKYTYREYQEGLLLYELMQREIWQRASKDTVGYTAYFEKHRSKYLQALQLRYKVYQCPTEKQAKRLYAQLQKQQAPELSQKFASKLKGVKWQARQSTVEKPSEWTAAFPLVKGHYGPVKVEDFYEVYEVEEVLEPKQMTLTLARSQVVQDYQQWLEQQWMEKLRSEATIEVNAAALHDLKQQL